MTNSEKQTKKSPAKGEGQGKAEEEGTLPSYARGDFWVRVVAEKPTLIIGGMLLLVGWGFSLHINRWHFTVPVVVLWLGWVGVLATVRFLWSSGAAAAGELAGDREEEVDVSDARRRELFMEKKSLLQAIKEIEFDRDLGKMSDDDATELMRFYRSRAIEVIKEIDGVRDESLTVRQRIARDLEARMILENKGRKAAPAKKPDAAEQAAEQGPESEVEAPMESA